MATARLRIIALSVTLVALAQGCSQSGPLRSRQTMVGSLKASVSQLEYENGNLKKQVGELQSQNRQIATELDQEKEASGEYAARLDDAKTLLRRQGGDVASLGAPTKSPEDDIPPPVSTRRTKGARKPPAAQIRNHPESPATDADPSFDPAPADPGPRTSNDDDDRWLPVARGVNSRPLR